jgi:hypothetical protein
MIFHSAVKIKKKVEIAISTFMKIWEISQNSTLEQAL